MNSTNTNETTLDTISNCTAVEDSKLANNSMSLYCDTRTTFFIGFIISLAVLVIVSIYSCYTLSDKIKTLKEYYEVTERIDKHPYDDKLRSELTNLDKNFLESLYSHDWGLAKEFLKRIKIVSDREIKDNRINPSVSSNNNKSNET